MGSMGKGVAMVLAVAGLLVFTAMDAWAVPRDVEAESEYILADDMYNKKDFGEAVEHALAAKRLLPQTNPRIESILARAYVSMGKSIPAYGALEKYFELASESDKDYAELVALYDKIKVERVEKAKKQAASYLDKIEMIKVPAGCFQMGDIFGNGEMVHNYNNERPVHKVCLEAFSMSKFEVTLGLWQAVMGDNPTNLHKGLDYPIEEVSWNDARDFLKALNAKLGKAFRLPTEAEWEYACRSGGKKEKYCGGDTIDELAWYKENSGGSTHPVGQKSANGLGLHDMSGNVEEWVRDWYDEKYYATSPKRNPAGAVSGTDRVCRGGDWSGDPGDVRAATRGWAESGNRSYGLGLRLVLPPGQ